MVFSYGFNKEVTMTNYRHMLTFSHCRRKNGIGGEDIALDRIKSQASTVILNTYEAPNNQLLGLLSFIFSLHYFLYVLKNKERVHIICNPFPYVSILSIILIGIFGIRLRYYLHDFSASCPANTHFREGAQCFQYLKNRTCLRESCVPSKKHLILAFVRHYIFFGIFKMFRCNKIYFVSLYQKDLAVKSSLIPAQCIVVGNVE